MSGTLSLTFNVSSAPTDATVTLPLIGTSVEATIDWGDGNTDTGMVAPFTHAYGSNGLFTAVVTITSADGSVTQFGADDWPGVRILTAVTTSNNTTWGLRGATSFSFAFNRAYLLTSVPTQVPSSVADMSSMFRFTNVFNQDISSWNVSGVTNMNSMFQASVVFNQDISGWDVSSVTDMTLMFNSTNEFNNGAVGDVGGKPLTWTTGTGTSNVTSMYNMFSNATAFNQDISSWNVSSVTNMGFMFSDSSAFNNGGVALTWSTGTGTSNVTNMNSMFQSASTFNQDISGWNVSSVTNMQYMFYNARAFNNGGVALTWAAGTGTSNVTNMQWMFRGPCVFNQDISSWNVSSVTNMNNMFCSNSAFNNGAIGNVGGKPLTWTAGTGTSNVTNMSDMFNNSGAFNQDISSWNVSSVTNMGNMFETSPIFNQDISSWNVSNVTNMYAMFYYATSFNQDISSWNVSSVTNMAFMFRNASIFNQDISSWNVSSVTDMSYMFFAARVFNNGSITNDGLHPLTWTAGTGTSNVVYMNRMFDQSAFNQTISGWNVSKVTDMSGMFANIPFNNGSTTNDGLHPLTWTAGTGTSKVTNMSTMFDSNTAFNQTITSWNVSSVTLMGQMFYQRSTFNNGSLTNDQLHPLTSWDVSKVTDMSYMFGNCSAFNQDISSWNVSNVTTMYAMFARCSLFNQNISSWNVSKVTTMWAMFSNASVFNQDISSWNVSNVLTMPSMFENAIAFNKNIRGWKVQASININNMFLDATAFQTAFYPTTPGYNPSTGGNATPLYTFFTPITLTLTFGNTPGSVTLPISGSSVAVSVDWGDSTIDTSLSHTYAGAGPYNAVVAITGGSVTSFGSPAWTGVNKLIAVSTNSVSTWGLGASLTSFANAFDGATILTSVPSYIPSSVTNASSMFKDAYTFDQDISGWDVSHITNMSFMFNAATSFNQDISLWGVGSVTDMSSMFSGALIFNQDIRPWIVSASVTLTNMFQSATAFQTAFYPTTPGYNTDPDTPLYTFFEPFSLTLTFSNTPGSVTLPISGTSVAVSVDWGDSTINTSLSHTYSGAGPYDAKIIITSGSVTTFGSDGWTGVAKLTAVSTNKTSNWGLGASVTSFANCFKGAGLLTSVPSNIPSSVTNIQSMFQGATLFNQAIGGWNVANITNMISMFNGATTFNKKIRTWKVGAGTTLTNMFSGATAFQAAFYPTTPGYNAFSGGNATPLYIFFNLLPYPCFLEGTQILCFENGKEVYRPVQSLRKGDLVKTIYNGYLPIHMIGTSPMYNPDNDDRNASRLYRCSKENYPGLFEDLYITGCHSILVPKITYKQAQTTIASLGRLFVTDKHCRLMAWVDEKSEPYKMAGIYNIYHIALENNDYYMNYGIYANGLLVESCSKRYLTELSNMRILGEEDCAVSENVDKVLIRDLVSTY